MEIERCRTPGEIQETVNILAPFLSSAVVNELCSGRQFVEYRARQMEFLRSQFHQAIDYQRRVIAPELVRMTPRRVDGFRLVARFEDRIEFMLRRKYGPGCLTKDPDFLKHTLKHSPEVRVPKPACPFVVVNGFRDDRGSGPREQSRRPDGSNDAGRSDRNAGAANGAPALTGGTADPRQPAGRSGDGDLTLLPSTTHETKRAPNPSADPTQPTLTL